MGFGNIQAARSAVANSQTPNKPKTIPTWMQEIWALIPDESVIVRFVGGPAEPYIFHQHGFARHPERGFEKGICLGGNACPMCSAAAVPGERRVKRATPYAAFSIYSTRKMLKIPTETQDGKTYNKKEPLRVNSDGEHIYKLNGNVSIHQGGVDPRANQYETEDEGTKIWCGSLHPKANNADKLLALDMRLQKLCQCGSTVGEGMSARPAGITVEGHSCEECGENLNYSSDSVGDAVCSSCGHVGVPNEALSCTANCGSPKRGGLTHCYVRVTRRGAGTDTTYDFTPLPFSSSEHPLEQKDLKTIYAPNGESVNEMLLIRGITPGGGSTQGNSNSKDVPW
tara:strand:+ start:684 stop:1703 length:1020 start_codon:yes stop_codon:yes gene_type:complete